MMKRLIDVIVKARDFIWGWSLMGEALCLDRLINLVGEGSKLQNWLVVRSFRTAIAGANRLTGGMFDPARQDTKRPMDNMIDDTWSPRAGAELSAGHAFRARLRRMSEKDMEKRVTR